MDATGDGLEWSVAARPIAGESESGDCHFVRQTRYGWLLVVADGLGHGREAATASHALLAALGEHAEARLPQLIQLCHEALRHTRGSAVSMAALDAGTDTLCWLGVGNVEALLCPAAGGPHQYIDARGGIVGYRLPELRPATLPLHDGDLLVFATDGVDEEFIEALAPGADLNRLAGRLLATYGKATDDALVLLARWHARAPASRSDA